MRPVYIGLIGAGTVGRGVIDSIVENGKLIADRTGVSIVLKAVCDKDVEALNSITGIEGLVKTDKADEIINNEEIDIVVELIGGVHPAKDIIVDALAGKKHVVTANKALLSGHWKDIFKTALDNGVYINFEASVGGGIPIIRAISESFVSNDLELIYGILNGTTNFILTMMADQEYSFDKALAVARKKGIAEPDPKLDINGQDSAHKLVILALLGFGIDISPDDIYTEGIQNISPQDIKCARQWGYSIKLLAIAKKTQKGLQLRVHPTLLPARHLLANVKGEYNAIFVKGDFIGDSLLYGKGAGRRPTASSVMGDIVELAKHVAFSGKESYVPYKPLYAPGSIPVVNEEDINIPFYLRFSAIDRPGVLAGISSVLAENEISIASMSQEERKKGQPVPVIMLTHNAREGSMRKAVKQIDKMEFVTDKTVVIRIEQ